MYCGGPYVHESAIMKLFGKAKKAPSAKESIARLKDTIEMLEKREAYLQKKIEREIATARHHGTKNKKAAIAALKRKKIYEGEVEKIGGARMTIETQVMAIEGANVSLETLNAMRLGAETMRNIHRNMTIDEVDDTMEEIREQMQVANEINEAIASPLVEQFDEDELEQELAQLEEQNLEVQFLDAGKLPDAPTTTLEVKPPAIVPIVAAKRPVAVPSDDDDLRNLGESMAVNV